MNEEVHLIHGGDININGLPEIEIFKPKQFVYNVNNSISDGGKWTGMKKYLYEKQDLYSWSKYEIEIVSFDNLQLIIKFNKNGNGDTIYGVYDYKPIITHK